MQLVRIGVLIYRAYARKRVWPCKASKLGRELQLRAGRNPFVSNANTSPGIPVLLGTFLEK